MYTFKKAVYSLTINSGIMAILVKMRNFGIHFRYRKTWVYCLKICQFLNIPFLTLYFLYNRYFHGKPTHSGFWLFLLVTVAYIVFIHEFELHTVMDLYVVKSGHLGLLLQMLAIFRLTYDYDLNKIDTVRKVSKRPPIVI